MLYFPLSAIKATEPLAGTFLGSTDPLPIPETGEGGWMSGVALPSFIGAEPGGWPGAPCQADYEDDWSTIFEETVTLTDKAQTFEACENYVFDPFTIFHMLDSNAAQGATNPGVSRDQEARFRGYLDNWMAVQSSAGVARAFYRGAPQDGLVVGATNRNPIPRTAAVDLTAAMGTPAAVSPETAFANLSAAYYDCSFGGGAVMHVPPLILPFLISKGLVAQVGTRFLGPRGMVVISDPGMPSNRELFSDGSGSDSTDYPANNIGLNYETTEGQCWMFITGGILASVGAVTAPLGDEGQIFDVRLNRWMYVLEQRAIFAWDPDCCFAAAVFAPSPGTTEP